MIIKMSLCCFWYYYLFLLTNISLAKTHGYLDIYHCWNLLNQFVFAVNYFILRWTSSSVGRNITHLAFQSFSTLGFSVLIFVSMVSWADGRIQTSLDVTSHSCISKLNHWQNSLHLCFVRAFRWVQISERKPVIGMTKSFYSAFPGIFQTVLHIMWDMFPSTSLPIYYILVIYRCVPALTNMQPSREQLAGPIQFNAHNITCL